MAKLCWTSRDGHTEVEYDTEVHSEVRKAEARFEELLSAQGTAAYRVETDSVTGKRVAQPLSEFDPTAEEILVTSPMVGG